MKNASVPFTYSSRRKIFLQGCPLERWHSHARRPAATLPTRFSIKQANNTIPTPINKWSFLNKVLYTEPLAEATHHNLMGSCSGQSYSSPPYYLYLGAEAAETGRADEPSSSCHGWTQHRLRYSTISFMRRSTCAFLPLLFLSDSLISFMHTNSLSFLPGYFLSFGRSGCSQQFEHWVRWLARCLGVCQRGAIVSCFLIRFTWQKSHQIWYTTENMRRDHT